MWIFNNGTGELLDPDGQRIEMGYAGGDHGLHKEGINNPSLQYVRDVGPLPVGLYTMGTPVEGSHLGPLAIPLTPDPSNEMGGRSGFFVHGDRSNAYRSASDGCMIFSHSTRVLLSQSDDRQIQVI